MKPVFSTAAAAAVLLLVASGSSVSGQELTSDQEAAVEAEAQQHVERYYNYYYERNPEALSKEIFTHPWISITWDGFRVTRTEQESLARFEAAIAGLIERDWNRSIFATKNVCAVTAGSAIVSGTNTRTRADGSVMSVNGVSYILGKTDEGWRTISFLSHSPDKIVRCDTP